MHYAIYPTLRENAFEGGTSSPTWWQLDTHINMKMIAFLNGQKKNNRLTKTLLGNGQNYPKTYGYIQTPGQ